MDTPEPAELLRDPSASTWLCTALRSALQRDPVDAAADAELLAAVLARHADACLAAALQAIQTGKVPR